LPGNSNRNAKEGNRLGTELSKKESKLVLFFWKVLIYVRIRQTTTESRN
jgi:hypothetical protein